MISSFEALEWLNAIDGPSRLTAEERGLSLAARIASYSEAETRRLLTDLRNAGQSSADPFERAEVSLHLAAIEYWREWYAESVQDAGEAEQTYRSDSHRHAVAQWLLGMPQWRISQNINAYRNCDTAREFFRMRSRELQPQPNLMAWYEDWAWQMDLELTAKLEEIYTWLNHFEAPNLSATSRQLENFITENVGQQRYSDVYALMRDMQQSSQWSTDIYERAAVSFECGLAAYQMGNLDFATELLKKAVVDFSPGLGNNHKQVVARCMLGAVEWLHPGLRNQAAIKWRRCIEEFRELMRQADYANNQQGRQWYADRITMLEAALAERLPGGSPQGNKPRRPGPPPADPGTPPPDDSPGPSTPSPDAGDRFSYESLLRKVGGDRLTAERLIEYERSRAPHASRDELIRRAIERWEDDNR